MPYQIVNTDSFYICNLHPSFFTSSAYNFCNLKYILINLNLQYHKYTTDYGPTFLWQEMCVGILYVTAYFLVCGFCMTTSLIKSLMNLFMHYGFLFSQNQRKVNKTSRRGVKPHANTAFQTIKRPGGLSIIPHLPIWIFF